MQQLKIIKDFYGEEEQKDALADNDYGHCLIMEYEEKLKEQEKIWQLELSVKHEKARARMKAEEESKKTALEEQAMREQAKKEELEHHENEWEWKEEEMRQKALEKERAYTEQLEMQIRKESEEEKEQLECEKLDKKVRGPLLTRLCKEHSLAPVASEWKNESSENLSVKQEDFIDGDINDVRRKLELDSDACGSPQSKKLKT